MSQGTPPPHKISTNLHHKSHVKPKKKSSRRRSNSSLKLLRENTTATPSISSHSKKTKSRKKLIQSAKPTHKKRRSRSNVDLLKPQNISFSNRHSHSHESNDIIDNPNNNNQLSGAAYSKGDIVLTKDTEAKMCVIKQIRNQNGLQYGISIPPNSGIDRYIKPGKIVKKVAPESIISHIDTIQKAYDDSASELLKCQQQNSMLRKQIEREELKFKKLKQRFQDQNSIANSKDKKLHDLNKENNKLKKEIEIKISDFNKLKKEMCDDNIYKKQINELNKQIRQFTNTIKSQKMIMNKQKTELSQVKALNNRNRLGGQTDNKQIIKLNKDKIKCDKIISDLRQQLHLQKNKMKGREYQTERKDRVDKLDTLNNLEQLNIQNRKLEQKLKKLKNREFELNEKERLQLLQQKDWKLNKNKLSLQQQQDIHVQEKVFNRKKKQELADIQKRRQSLLKQQKLLKMVKSGKKSDSKTFLSKSKRYERIRNDKTKIIIHKKYLCKEYMDTCVKWRKRKDDINKTNNRLQLLEEKLKQKYKRLQSLDENKRISKGKNKTEKPNKNDLKEYLDVYLPLEDIEDELGNILLDMHPDSKKLRDMPFELIQQQTEIDRLENELDCLENELKKYKLAAKLTPITQGGFIIDDDENMNDDEMKEGGHSENINPYKTEFSGLYRKVAVLGDNREIILSELKMLINKIGKDINDENGNMDGQFMMQLSSNYKDNGFMDFVDKTEGLCDEYIKLENELNVDEPLPGEDDEKKQQVITKQKAKLKPRKRRKRQKMRKESTDDGTSDSDSNSDSSSIMVESDDDNIDEYLSHTRGGDNDWNGTQRLSVNNKNIKGKNRLSRVNLQKTQLKLDDLTDKVKTHEVGLKKKDGEYKLMKQKISYARKYFEKCQGLLEIIEDEYKKNNMDGYDIVNTKESLMAYNELVEKANMNLEDANMSLQRDDQRVMELMQQLQKLQTKIADQKLKRVQDQFEEIKTGTEVIPVPNLLELQDLRTKIKTLYSKASEDCDYLTSSMKSLEKTKKKSLRLSNKVDDLSPSIHKFCRRPQTKIMEYMMEYNYDLGEISDKLRTRQDTLSKFSHKNCDKRSEQSIDLEKQFTEQETILDEYKKTISILEARHKGIMFETSNDNVIVTESGPVYQLEKIMDEIKDLLLNTVEKINDNSLNLRSQLLYCFVRLEEINKTRDVIVDTVQIPIPSKPNIEDLNHDDQKDSSNDDTDDTDDDDDDTDKGAHLQAHLKLQSIRKENKSKYNNSYVQKLAGLTDYDETVKIHLALNRIRATLGSASPLHYAVISNKWLKPKIESVKRELNKLLKNYEHFEPMKTDISIDDEVSNYKMQLVQDLASDYHKTNSTKQFIIDENIKIIKDKLNEYEMLNKMDLQCIELKHLKELYQSFVDKNLPQPNKLYQLSDNNSNDSNSSSSDEDERIQNTKRKDYKTEVAKQYVGLDDNNSDDNIDSLNKMISEINKELFKQRANVMPYAFNLIYQDGILFNAFPGDFNKFREYKHAEVDMTDDISHIDDDELLLNNKEYLSMERIDQIALIRELMRLEWQYSEWINNREDYVTQKMLWSEEALYYKRLFVLPLNDFYLEKERQKLLLSDHVTGCMRKYKKGIFMKEEKDRIAEMEEQQLMLRKKQDDSGFAGGGGPYKNMHSYNKNNKDNDSENDRDSFQQSNLYSKQKPGQEEKEDQSEYKNMNMMIGNKNKRGKHLSQWENSHEIHQQNHELGYQNNNSNNNSSSEYEDNTIIKQKGKKIQSQKNARKDQKKQKQSGIIEEYDSENDIEYDSDGEYLSVDSENNNQKGKKIKNNENKNNMEQKPGAHGIGMDVQIGYNNYKAELETTDFNDIHCSPNIHVLKTVLVNNAVVNQYIAQQVEEKLQEEQKQNENDLIEGSNTEYGSSEDDDSENSDNASGSEEEEEDGEDEYVIEKLREILDNHNQLNNELENENENENISEINEVDTLLDRVEDLCGDLNEYSNKYYSTTQKNKKLKSDISKIETRLNDLGNEHDMLKQEYLKLRQENEELQHKCHNYERYGYGNNKLTPNGYGHTAGGDYSDDSFDEKDMLGQLQDELLQLRQDINDSQQSAKQEYKDCKLRLENMCEPLNDLANDLNSETLKNALTKLQKSNNDITNLQKQRLYQHGPLANIIESNIDEIDDLLHECAKQKPSKIHNQSNGNNNNNNLIENGMENENEKYKYPELIFDGDDGKNNSNNNGEPGMDKYRYDRDDEKDKWKNTPGNGIEFDADFPKVIRIEIDGNWFNKKPRAVIEWNGQEFKRKMPDFKWLWRMLMLNASIDRIVPDYPSDIPESLWPEGYLRRRKRELNLFLMQCHSLPWIKKYKVYNDIFLETQKSEWKRKRNIHDQDIIDRIKNKKPTYNKNKDVIVEQNNNNNNNDNYDNDDDNNDDNIWNTNDNDPNYHD